MKRIRGYWGIGRKKMSSGNKKPMPNSFFPPIFKINIAVALLAILAFFVSAGDVIIQSGTIDVGGKLFVADNGNVGIGTASPGSRLEVKNTATENDVLLLEDSSGLCEAQPSATGLTWSCSSDIALKESITNASPVLGYVTSIPLFDYTVKKTGERAMGVIAQELNLTHPELVSVGDDGLLTASTPTAWQLVKAIQEQQEEIEYLKKRIEILEKK